MPILVTSKGKRYTVDFAWAPTLEGGCTIRLRDDRRLPEIAAEFDGLTALAYTDEAAMRSYTWEGYTRLISVNSLPAGVTVKLAREAEP